jgi:two-component system OmpR family sensor kinase
VTQSAWRFPRVSLFVQVLAFLAGTLIIAQGLTLWTVWNLPVPTPVTYRYGEIIRAYAGTPLPTDHLIVVEKGKPPRSSFELNNNDRQTGYVYRAALAARLTPQVRPEDIVMNTSYQRWRGFLPRPPRPPRAPGQQGPPNGPSPNPITEQVTVTPPFSIGVHQPDGSWTILRTPHTLAFLDPAQRLLLIWFASLTLAVILAAYLSARRLARPIVQFAEAAERLGRDPNAPPVTLQGSTEIVTAATAFNEMQQRLRRYVEDRTAMIGAIAHDLRTPLTRLRFRIESVPEDMRAKMSSDLDQMEAMISATLSFVRDATQQGERTRLELSSLLESLVDDMTDTGADVAFSSEEKVIIGGDPVGLKRLFSNLLENAVKYGKRARVRVKAEDGMAVVEIDDDGPGVPAAEVEKVFEPFYRREPSRNRETGGIGLGLAVVRTISRAHGGDATLENRKGGGLTARVRLPL